MFGTPKDDLQQELENYDKGRKNDVFEDYDVKPEAPSRPVQDTNAAWDSKNTAWNTDANINLAPGEQVLWQGQSRVGIGQKAQSAYVRVFGIFWLAFALFWTFLASMGGIAFAAFGIPFIIIGVVLVAKKPAKGNFYTITTNRIICGTNGNRSVFYSQISDLSYEISPSGVGSITFKQTYEVVSETISGVPNVEWLYDRMCEEIRKTEN